MANLDPFRVGDMQGVLSDTARDTSSYFSNLYRLTERMDRLLKAAIRDGFPGYEAVLRELLQKTRSMMKAANDLHDYASRYSLKGAGCSREEIHG